VRTGKFPGYLFDRLAEVCCELRVLELDDLYPCSFDDAPHVIVTVRHSSGVKVVHNEGGNSGPVRLWAFAALVEVAMRQVFEIEARRQDKGKGFSHLQRDPCEWGIRELNNPDPAVRCNAAEMLRGLAVEAVSALPALANGCGDSDDQVRLSCTQALVDIGNAVRNRMPSALPDLAAAVPPLVDALTDVSSEVRRLAAEALGVVGPSAAHAAPQLRRLLSDPDAEVRRSAARSLVSAGG
jgi:hypothetical protein